MALAQKNLEQIGQYVRTQIGEWLASEGMAKLPVVYEIELRERIV